MKIKLYFLAASLFALLFPNLNFGQNLVTPSLGPAASFVLFTNSGIITGDGLTPFTGNIGTNLGAITGFTNLTDPLFHTQDALTAACANYLPELFSTLKAIPKTFDHAAAFADGEVLIPGVYQIPIASTMAGTITLDGGGDTNAVFIFKIPGALALTAATNIKLTNGTSASNVFWIMDGAFAVGANSVLAGTFISQLGIIGIGAGCTLSGHIFNLSGAVTVTSSKLTLINSMILGESQSIAPGTLATNLTVTGNTTPIIKWQSSLTADFNIPTDIANTTTTLTGDSIGVLSLSTYYRAVTTLDGANTGSNAAKITITTPTIAPNLGPAASFVLFTSNGIVTGDGLTPFTGNIGTNLGAITGFTNLTDPLFHTQDALTAACANYLPELFSTLKAIPKTLDHVAAFADGEVLIPGVYQVPIASTMAGTITLDGGGDTNAVFIFKIPGALALTAATNIKLTNGTSASNVFWIMDGAFAAGANSVLAGTFISQLGIIGIGARCTLSGHIFNLSGAVTVTSSKLTLINSMILVESQSIAPGTLATNLTVTGNTTPIIKWQSSLTADFNIPTDIANTTTTLTGDSIGVLSLSTYYRAVTTLDGANTGSNAAKITITTPTIAPNLGPAASFVLFTSNGIVTGDGLTPFTGNIGTNLGAVVGFINLTDPLFHTQDALTAACANYLPELFSTLKAIPKTLDHVAAFADGEVLIPGVYQVPIASTMAGTITLDGGGDTNAVFIFKIPGALALTAATNIKLTNGTSASNVFWIMDGAFAAGANSVLAGTFISQLGIIGIGAGCSVNGHVFTLAGAITVTNTKLNLTNAMLLSASQTIAVNDIPADLIITGNTSPIIKWQSSLTADFNNAIDIPHYSAKLCGSCIGALDISTYFRAVTLIDGAVTSSNIVKIATSNATIVPNLGPAEPFLLFTSAGAIANAGISTFTGNIGTNAGIISGFSNMSDPKLHTQDNLTASCSNYILELFSNVKAIPTTNSTHPPAFGGGETVTAGVYQIAIASTMAGVLTLDAENNPNAVFIFKINGALALAAGAEIKLSNGASASNVFWNINGAFSAGANAILKGTFICENGIISLGANCTLDGHAYTNFGAVTLSNSSLTAVANTNSIIVSANQNIVAGTIPANLTLTGNTSSVLRWEKSSDALFTNPISITNTTTTLTGSEIGEVTTSTYFRAIVASAITTIYSTTVAIKIIQNTIPGIISANQNILVGDFPKNITISKNNGPVSKWQKSTTLNFTNPIDISSNYALLQGFEIGIPTETTYIRAIVQNCISTVSYTNVLTISIGTIFANKTTIEPINGAAGKTNVVNILTNATLNGSALTIDLINLTTVTPNDNLILNADGSLDVVPNTPAGTYTLTYQICEKLNATNCDQAVVVVEIFRKLPDFTPTIDIDGLVFISDLSTKDFVINISEIQEGLSDGPIVIKISKQSAFTITYGATASTSTAFGGVAVNNNDWVKTEDSLFITMTLKSSIIIGVNTFSAIGFTIKRKPNIPTQTSQPITVTIVNRSGLDSQNYNNTYNTVLKAQ